MCDCTVRKMLMVMLHSVIVYCDGVRHPTAIMLSKCSMLNVIRSHVNVATRSVSLVVKTGTIRSSVTS